MIYLLDPFEDQFEKRKTAKKERVAKNELQRLRNIKKNMKGGPGRLTNHFGTILPVCISSYCLNT